MLQEQLQGQEEEFVVPPHPKFNFNLTTQKKIKVKTLVIALYGPASLFAYALIPSKSPDSRVNFLKSKQTSLADIYLIESQNAAYMIFNGDVQKMKQLYFSQFISSNFEVQRIIILTHEYINNLQKNSNVCLQVSIPDKSQYLKTSSWKQSVNCNKYRQGLMGLGADLLIWGQINRLPVCCYIGLFKDYQLTRQMIKQVFGILNGKEGMNQITQIGERIKKYNMKKYSNNLYL